MSSRIFQNVIIQMKDAVDRTIGVVDEQGFVVASSELAMIGSRLDDFHLYEFDGSEHPVATGTRTYCALYSPGAKFDYAAFTEGTDAMSRTICSISAVAFNEAKNNYEEKHNKAAFIKNIISDNILPGDVYVRAKELHFVTDEPRVVLLVRQMENPDVAAVEAIRIGYAMQRGIVALVHIRLVGGAVGHRKALAALVPTALVLVCRRRAAPQKSLGKTCHVLPPYPIQNNAVAPVHAIHWVQRHVNSAFSQVNN